METRFKIASGILILLLIILLGTLGLSFLEHWPLFQALWVTVESLTTTGYGDYIPQTTAGKTFLMFILLSGVAVIGYSLGTVTNTVIERQITNMVEKSKMKNMIQKLENHIIVCGAGRVGRNVAAILKGEKVPFLVIDSNPEIALQMEKKGYLVMNEDATQDDILIFAGIKKAQGIICALPEDALNVFIALTARALNPAIKIVARANRPETINKLYQAGANRVISPEQIGGFQMAVAMLKPKTVELVDTIYTLGKTKLQLEEVIVTDDSPLAYQNIENLLSKMHNRINIVGIVRQNNILINPQPSEKILPEDTLIMIGFSEDLNKIEKIYLNSGA